MAGRRAPRTAKAPDRLLTATWNVANLGHPGQPRTDDDYGVIAELLSWFDLVTVQRSTTTSPGSASSRTGSRRLTRRSSRARPGTTSASPSSTTRTTSGSSGRSGRSRFRLPRAVHRAPRDRQEFRGFDRNPYLAAFRAGNLAGGSSIKKDLHYDQVAFFPPGASEQALVQASEVFDFDGALFKDLWEDRGKDDYFDYVRYHISDHRLLWAELAI